jgi:two-component system sensor histidine kinase KdpD
LTEENRPDPGLLLKKLQYEEKEKEKQTKGKLKIFLGYAKDVAFSWICGRIR